MVQKMVLQFVQYHIKRLFVRFGETVDAEVEGCLDSSQRREADKSYPIVGSSSCCSDAGKVGSDGVRDTFVFC